ncbi:MAG: hypothetical protein K0R18_863 [Bacillales bacterium]|jgi:hypothetical protein|nr:hypothetical protein [Bacillales bacterium]
MSILQNQRHFFWNPLKPLESPVTPDPLESPSLSQSTAFPIFPELSIPQTTPIPLKALKSSKQSKSSMPFIFSMPHIYPEPPKHPSEHSKPSSLPKQPCEHNNFCSSTLNEEISIEAKVTVIPEVSIGNVKIECLESTIDRFPDFKKCSSEECTVFVNQLIRVKIPIQFSAKTNAEKIGVICKIDDQEDCTE